jgi:hypothetical protein
MKRIATLFCAACMLGAAALPVSAKRPPPSPEEVAAAEQKKALELEQMKRDQAALTKVQDEVAARYRREHPGQRPQATGETRKEDLPRVSRDIPRGVGPHGRDEPSAEAHSAPAGTPGTR